MADLPLPFGDPERPLPKPIGPPPTVGPPEDDLPEEELNPVEEKIAGDITDPTLPPGADFVPEEQVAGEDEFIEGEEIDPEAEAAKAAAGQATAPGKADAATVEAATIGDATPQAKPQQGTVSDPAIIEAAQQHGVSPEYEAAYQQAVKDIQRTRVDPRALVQNQFKNLMDFGPGEVPDWARGAIKVAQQAMASRGIGGSTAAGEAVTSAVIQAAMPIAMQDAKVFETMTLEKMNLKAQAAFMKNAHLAQLDMANLNNRQQAAVINAQQFFAMDMANLNNRQQTAIFNAQARVQTMLSDQSATNAARQFNATSKNQVNMFYDNLSAQISTFNAAQRTDISKFNSEMFNMREQFNVKNALLVEQANTQYLRDINTRNTAVQNQANLINSQNLLEISNTAMANAITLLRDREAYAFELAENKLDRDLQRAIAELNAKTNLELGRLSSDTQLKLADDEMSFAIGASIGQFAGEVLGGLFGD